MKRYLASFTVAISIAPWGRPAVDKARSWMADAGITNLKWRSSGFDHRLCATICSFEFTCNEEDSTLLKLIAEKVSIKEI